MRKSPVQCRGTAIVHPANAASSFGEAAVSKERNGGARDPVMIWGLVCLLAISAGLLLWHHYGMNRTLRVTAADHYTIWPYDDRDLGGKSVGNVETTPSAIVLRCALKNHTRHLIAGSVWPLRGRPQRRSGALRHDCAGYRC